MAGDGSLFSHAVKATSFPGLLGSKGSGSEAAYCLYSRTLKDRPILLIIYYTENLS